MKYPSIRTIPKDMVMLRTMEEREAFRSYLMMLFTLTVVPSDSIRIEPSSSVL
jgi:hypothetical protein